MKTPRFSPQRELILQIVLDECGHLTAEDVYHRARKRLPKISLGTVYRNLGTLLELQKIAQMQGLNQVTYYEPFTNPHHHFICKSCGEITDMEAPTVKTCTSCIEGKVGVKVDTVLTTLFGTCAGCQ